MKSVQRGVYALMLLTRFYSSLEWNAVKHRFPTIICSSCKNLTVSVKIFGEEAETH